jgi:hypothetical protein
MTRVEPQNLHPSASMTAANLLAEPYARVDIPVMEFPQMTSAMAKRIVRNDGGQEAAP